MKMFFLWYFQKLVSDGSQFEGLMLVLEYHCKLDELVFAKTTSCDNQRSAD